MAGDWNTTTWALRDSQVCYRRTFDGMLMSETIANSPGLNVGFTTLYYPRPSLASRNNSCSLKFSPAAEFSKFDIESFPIISGGPMSSS
jgi:hypothetical protein